MNSQQTYNTNKKGFTLIELLVVISIIGILAAFIVASFTSAQQKARDSRRKADLDALRKALELYKTDTQGSKFYPQFAAGNVLPATLAPNYIKNIPVDPQNGNSYGYFSSPVAPACTANCTAYRLVATLENASDPQAAGASFNAGSAIVCPNNTDSFTQAIVGYTAKTYVVCQQ